MSLPAGWQKHKNFQSSKSEPVMLKIAAVPRLFPVVGSTRLCLPNVE